ncbi:hypothetical protein PUN4_160088 [Paraburkholderia unamae]|nr:hypothetical protein PUN4_160088 [Paraburkholderia unamae]
MGTINLTSKTARAALTPRREPYWVRVSAGCFLGYRKGAAADGSFIARTHHRFQDRVAHLHSHQDA